MYENLLPSCNAMHVLICRWFSQSLVKDDKISHLIWVNSWGKAGTELANVPDVNKLYNNDRVYGIMRSL